MPKLTVINLGGDQPTLIGVNNGRVTTQSGVATGPPVNVVLPPNNSTSSTPYTQQFSELSQWIVNHNLGYRPAVEVYNIGWQEIDADVVHLTNNQFVVNFTKPTQGVALYK